MKIFQFPLTKITVFFLTGIVAAYWVKFSVFWVLMLLILAVFVYGIAFFWRQKKLFFGIATSFLALIIGISTQTIHTDFFKENHFIHSKSIAEKPHQINFVVREKLRSTQIYDRYIGIVKQIDNQKKVGKILVQIDRDSLPVLIEIGSQLRFNGMVYINKSSKNPNQFEYSKYLENKQIYAKIYASVSELKISNVVQKDIWYYTAKLRTKIIRNLEKNDFANAELNVSIALILGQQQDILPEIVKNYQYAGAVHILSVSGLHIGFILVFVMYLLKPFPNSKKWNFIKLIIVLLSLFSFGFIAGLAPSVVRSVVMFSFFAVAMHLQRGANIFHTLLVSMLLILLFEPSFLFDVGFQLSYLALFFIIWLQPLLSKIWRPKNKIAKYFWDILTVSFAAQMGTLPLCIYYFHQFPGLFFATNLIILPFLSVIMALGVVVMILAAVDFLPVFLSQSLEFSIRILNKVIHTIASFEDFIFRDISLNWQLLLSMYLFLFSSIIWFKKPKYHSFIGVLVGVVILQLAFLQTKYSVNNQQELIVFHVKKNTIISERNGTEIKLFANDSILKSAIHNQTLTNYAVGNFSQISSKNNLKNLLYFNDKKILILDSLGVYPKQNVADILLITQSPKINFERLFLTQKPKMVVADGSNYKSYVALWKATCEKHKIPFQSTAEKGFYGLKYPAFRLLKPNQY